MEKNNSLLEKYVVIGLTILVIVIISVNVIVNIL